MPYAKKKVSEPIDIMNKENTLSVFSVILSASDRYKDVAYKGSAGAIVEGSYAAMVEPPRWSAFVKRDFLNVSERYYSAVQYK